MTHLRYMLGLTLLLSLFTFIAKAVINLPDFGNVTYVEKGSNVTINWTFTDLESDISARRWSFSNTSTPDFKVLGIIAAGLYKQSPTSPLTNVEGTKTGTLIVKDINLDHNGTYRFELERHFGGHPPPSDVLVIVKVQPTAAVSCLSNNTIKEGDNFSCFCNGTTGNPPPSATWSKNGVVTNGIGFKTKELVFENVTKHMTGIYSCAVRSHDLTDSKVIKLLVHYSPKDVSIRTNSSSTYVEINTTVAIICTADAFPNANYTISRNGTTLPSVNGVYIINSVKSSDSGQYDCVAENIIGKTSRSFQLNVKVRPMANANCSGKPNVVNESNAFTCLCENIGGYPPPNASWTKVGEKFLINGMGYLNNTLSFNNISRNDTGNYTCKVQSLIDFSNSITIEVLVQYSPENVRFKANISRTYVEVNTTVAITCTGDAFPEARYTISRNGTTLPSANGVYIINSVKLNDSGRYDCVAENIVGNKPKSFQLNVKVQPIAKTNCSGKPNVVNEGDAFTCLCESIGGYPLPNASWIKVRENGAINGVGYLKKTLSFNNISRADTGNYTCKVESLSDLFDSITIQVHVQFKPELLLFGSNATNNIVVVGSPVKISWKADGNPRPKFFLWHDRRVQQIGDYDEEYIISSVNSSHAGKYDCRAENKLGNNTKSFNLRVHVPLPSGPTPSESDTGLSTGAIAGIAAGGLVFLILLLIIFCWLIPLIKQRKREKEEPQAEEAIMNSPGVNTLDGNAAKPENPYELAEEGIENGGADSDRPTTSPTDKSTEEGNENGGADSDRPSTSATDNSSAPAAEPGLPPVYAVVDKSKLSVKKKPVDPSQLTYASLDPIALQPDSSKMRPRPKEESNYASIDLAKL